MEVFYLYAIDMVGTMVGQIRNQRLNPAINLVQEGPGGSVDQHYAAIAGGQPAVGFTSSACAKMIDECGFDGTAITGAAPFNSWWQKGEDGGLRAASGHIKMSIVQGLIYPLSLRAPHVPPATIDYNVIAAYDEAVLPIQITSAALGVAPVADELFCAGPVITAGVEFEGVQDITVNFGITPEVQSHKGIPWPIYTGIRQRLPQVVVSFLDASFLDNIDLDGWMGQSTIYLRKLQEGGTRVPDATTEHIKVDMAKSMVILGDTTAATPNTASNTITITPVYDAADPSPPPSIEIDTASALP